VSGPIGPGKSFRRAQSRRKRSSRTAKRRTENYNSSPDPKPPGWDLPARESPFGISEVRDSFSGSSRPRSPPIHGRARGWIRLQKSTNGAWRKGAWVMSPRSAPRLAGLQESLANERRKPNRGGEVSRSVAGQGLRESGGQGIRRWKAPGASRPGPVVDATGPGRGSAGLSGFGPKASCHGAPEVGKAPRTAAENAALEGSRSEGFARSAARQGPSGTRRTGLVPVQNACLPLTEVRSAPSNAPRPAPLACLTAHDDGNRTIRGCS
jgi:hypothetical protein